jgi:hypothetical protein
MARNRMYRNIIGLAALLLATFWLGAALPLRTARTADVQTPRMNLDNVQQAPPKESFLGGDERSLPVLKEIAATVKQMDGRLERIEKLLGDGQKQ